MRTIKTITALFLTLVRGAASLPADALLTPDGRYRDRDEITRLFVDLVGGPGAPVVLFSDTGLLAAIGWFALHEIAGQRDLCLYGGSYLDWEGFGDELIDDYSEDTGGSWGG